MNNTLHDLIKITKTLVRTYSDAKKKLINQVSEMPLGINDCDIIID